MIAPGILRGCAAFALLCAAACASTPAPPPAPPTETGPQQKVVLRAIKHPPELEAVALDLEPVLCSFLGVTLGTSLVCPSDVRAMSAHLTATAALGGCEGGSDCVDRVLALQQGEQELRVALERDGSGLTLAGDRLASDGVRLGSAKRSAPDAAGLQPQLESFAAELLRRR